MDFNDTQEEAAFRQQAYNWLSENAELRSKDSTDAFASLQETEVVDLAKAWQAKKAAAGFACLSWPKTYGGQGAKPMNDIIWEQEEAKFKVPPNIFLIGLGMCAPTMMAFATEEQKQHYIPRLASGEDIWCQLFSEPSAGSDLAGLRTKAVKDGDDWLLTGQKIWTSGAHYSDYGLIIARTDFNAAKHKGLTAFFFSMHSEGVEVRNIKQISGDSNFNEVFFDQLRIPDSQRLGDVGAGWQVALTTLMNERLAIRDIPGTDFQEAFDLAKTVQLETGLAIDHQHIRQQLAHWYCQSMGLKNTKYRLLSAISQGNLPGPEASISKLVSASQRQQIGAFGMDLLDQAGVLLEPDEEEFPFMHQFQASYLRAPGYRVAGGTDEVLRNIIAERILGLPQETREDKGLPFNEVPTSSKT